jgi:hypothetical protein
VNSYYEVRGSLDSNPVVQTNSFQLDKFLAMIRRT